MTEVQSNEVPFAVLEDEVIPPHVGLEVEIYKHDDPNTRIDVVPFRWNVTCLDEIAKTGGGSFEMWRRDEKLTDSPTLLDWRNIVRVKLNHQTVGAFLIQNKEADVVSRDEISGETWKITGEGLRTWFKDATVYPFGGLKAKSAPQRVFSFASEQGAWYKAEDWITPVEIQQHNLDPNPGPWGTAPAQWPDAPEAWWIWGQYNDQTTPAPAGYNFFRYEFDIAEGVGTKNYSLFAAGDNQMVAYIDSQEVITADENDSWTKTWRADVELSPGHHVIAFRVLNTGVSPAALIAAFYRAGDAAAETAAELLTVTGDAGWLVNPYPDPAPGWTAGEIMLTLLAEADARGVQFPSFLTPTFTSEVDSAGESWTRALDWNFALGTEYYEVIERLEEAVCDLWINPHTLELDMFVQRGVDRTQQSVATTPIKFEVGKNVLRAHEEGTSDIKNTLMLSTTDGWYSQSDALTESISKYGRIEGNLSTGLSPDVSGDVAVSVFAQKAIPTMAQTYDIIDFEDNRPFVDFGVGDYVLAPKEDGTLGPIRILSLSVAENTKTGEPQYAVEFGTITDDIATRHERWLKTIQNAALGGTVSNVGGGASGSSANPAQATQDGPQGPAGPAGPAGMRYVGNWDDSVSYDAYDGVSHEGSTWISDVSGNLDSEPSESNPDWTLMAASGEQGPAGPAGPGITYKGTWDVADTYTNGDLVLLDGVYYLANTDTTGDEPPSAEWDVYTAGAGDVVSTDAGNLIEMGTDGLAFLPESALPDGLPAQTGKSGKYLKTDGTVATWEAASAGEFKGTWNSANTYIQGDQVVYGTAQYKALRVPLSTEVPGVAGTVTHTGCWSTSVTNFATEAAMKFTTPTAGTYSQIRLNHSGDGRIGVTAAKPTSTGSISWLAYADVTGGNTDHVVALNTPLVIAPGTAEIWLVWLGSSGGTIRATPGSYTDTGGTSVPPTYYSSAFNLSLAYRMTTELLAPSDAWLKIYDLPTEISADTVKGEWSSSTSYVKNDVVIRGGATYVALSTNINQDPGAPIVPTEQGAGASTSSTSTNGSMAQTFTVSATLSITEVDAYSVGTPFAVGTTVGIVAVPGGTWTGVRPYTYMGKFTTTVAQSAVGLLRVTLDTPVLLVPGTTYAVLAENVTTQPTVAVLAGSNQRSGLVATTPKNYYGGGAANISNDNGAYTMRFALRGVLGVPLWALIAPAGGGGGVSADTIKGTWSSATTYAKNDVVLRSGSTYVAASSSTNVDPAATDPSTTLGTSTGTAGSYMNAFIRSAFTVNANRRITKLKVTSAPSPYAIGTTIGLVPSTWNGTTTPPWLGKFTLTAAQATVGDLTVTLDTPVDVAAGATYQIVVVGSNNTAVYNSGNAISGLISAINSTIWYGTTETAITTTLSGYQMPFALIGYDTSTASWLLLSAASAGGSADGAYKGSWSPSNAYIVGDTVSVGSELWAATAPQSAGGLAVPQFIGRSVVGGGAAVPAGLTITNPAGTAIGDFQVLTVNGWNTLPVVADAAWTLLGSVGPGSSECGRIYTRTVAALSVPTLDANTYSATLTTWRNADVSSVTMTVQSTPPAPTSPAFSDPTKSAITRYWFLNSGGSAPTITTAGLLNTFASTGTYVGVVGGDEYPLVAGAAPARTWTGTGSATANVKNATVALKGSGSFNPTGWVKIADRLPTQSGNTGKFLSTDGTVATWASADAIKAASIKGTWASTTTYATNDVVQHNGASYAALTPNNNVDPTVLPTTDTVQGASAIGSGASGISSNMIRQPFTVNAARRITKVSLTSLGGGFPSGAIIGLVPGSWDGTTTPPWLGKYTLPAAQSAAGSLTVTLDVPVDVVAGSYQVVITGNRAKYGPTSSNTLSGVVSAVGTPYYGATATTLTTAFAGQAFEFDLIGYALNATWALLASGLPVSTTADNGKLLGVTAGVPGWVAVGLASRVDAVLAATSGNSSVALSKGARVVKITSSAATRFRLYRSTAQRSADSARALGTDPVGDAVLVEVNFLTGSTIWLNPIVDIANDDATYYTITSATADITLAWEATA